jgi:predicted RNase H-like nuclease
VRVVGIDGCRGGWLAACCDDNDVAWSWSRDVAALLDASAQVIAIDIPIGLPRAGNRACDVLARRALGRRGATVFAAPVRPVLACTSYAEARAVLADLGGQSMSAQAWGIVAAVRAVDRAVSAADEPRIVEAHPELAFAQMTGTSLLPKKTPEGRAQRLGALRSYWPEVDDIAARAPRPAASDDALDALACAWAARRFARGEALVLTDGARDERGLLMRIVA